MWLFTNVGFFSVVTAPAVLGKDTLVVRARVSGDLDALRAKYAPELGETVDNAGTDYSYRAFISRQAWGRAVRAIAEGVDYHNFKDEVAAKQGRARHDLYGRVWGVMADAEEFLYRPAPDPLLRKVRKARR